MGALSVRFTDLHTVQRASALSLELTLDNSTARVRNQRTLPASQFIDVDQTSTKHLFPNPAFSHPFQVRYPRGLHLTVPTR